MHDLKLIPIVKQMGWGNLVPRRIDSLRHSLQTQLSFF